MKSTERHFSIPPRGVYTAKWIPYGYRYDPDSPAMVIIDTEVAEAIRYLFREYLSGETVARIAQKLEDAGYPTPAKRREQLGLPSRAGRNPDLEHWNATALNQAFFHPIYAGDLIHSGRIWDAVYYYAGQPAPEGVVLPVIEENHHEALISREDMKKACERFLEERAQRNARQEGRRKKTNPGSPETPQTFSLAAVTRCGECGRLMNEIQLQIGGQPCTAYLCSGLSLQQPSKCTNRFYRQSELIAALLPAVEAERKMAVKILQQVSDESKNQQYRRIENNLQRQIDKAIDSVRKNMTETKRMETRYQAGALSDGEYQAESERLKREDDAYSRQVMDALIRIREFREVCTPDNPWLALFAALPESDALAQAPDCLQPAVERINVFPDQPPEILLARTQEKEELLAALGKPLRVRKNEPPSQEESS